MHTASQHRRAVFISTPVSTSPLLHSFSASAQVRDGFAGYLIVGMVVGCPHISRHGFSWYVASFIARVARCADHTPTFPLACFGTRASSNCMGESCPIDRCAGNTTPCFRTRGARL
jgi:hypothetical protein